MKHLKTKLMASLAMLMVATVMLSSASFAWFTISTAPEVEGVTTNVAANGNLEIALYSGAVDANNKPVEPGESNTGDNKKNETWGNLVDLSKAFVTTSDSGTTVHFALKPVSATFTSDTDAGTTDVVFKAPTFDTDGRIIDASTTLYRRTVSDAMTATTPAKVADYGDFGGVFLYSSEAEPTGENASKDLTLAADNKVWAYEVDYWLRTNVADSTVGLTGATGADRGNGSVGLGSWVDSKDITIKIVDGADVYDVAYGTVTKNQDGTYSFTEATQATNIAAENEDAHNVWPIAIGTWSGTGTSKTFTPARISLTQNTAKLVKMYVYWAGDNMKNSDFSNTALSGVKMNVQFESSETLSSLAK